MLVVCSNFFKPRPYCLSFHVLPMLFSLIAVELNLLYRFSWVGSSLSTLMHSKSKCETLRHCCWHMGWFEVRCEWSGTKHERPVSLMFDVSCLFLHAGRLAQRRLLQENGSRLRSAVPKHGWRRWRVSVGWQVQGTQGKIFPLLIDLFPWACTFWISFTWQISFDCFSSSGLTPGHCYIWSLLLHLVTVVTSGHCCIRKNQPFTGQLFCTKSHYVTQYFIFRETFL